MVGLLGCPVREGGSESVRCDVSFFVSFFVSFHVSVDALEDEIHRADWSAGLGPGEDVVVGARLLHLLQDLEGRIG